MQQIQELASPIDHAVARLLAWLETMRGPGGYGGPVAHWWQQSLLYTGTGHDWRYEGIIAGYLSLWQRSGDPQWLALARRAGDDLVEGQLASGHYAASAFEINPAAGGTPHEAAVDLGLLLLADALRSIESPDWQIYAECALRNLRTFYLAQLWDAQVRAFRDHPDMPSFVPNKAATLCEALFLAAEISDNADWVEAYALPTLDHIVAHQMRAGGPLAGAIAQNSFGKRMVLRYFPIYIARCVPALLRGYHWSGDERYADSALQAMAFIARWINADGSLPTVIYANRKIARFPTWIAPVGDVLRAADLVRPYGFSANLDPLVQHLLAGQDDSGAFQTARGFAAQAGGRPGALPDLRDVLHVVGWCDKALRYLAAQVGPYLPVGESKPFTVECVFRGQRLQLLETPKQLQLVGRYGVCYRWWKGDPWPEIADRTFWLR